MTTITTETITLTIDGQTVIVPQGTSIWEAAKSVGIEIPVLCHSPRLDPVGACRMCVVDVGERVLVASCMRECTDGMSVETSSEKVQRQRKMLTELLLSEHPIPCEREQTTADCQLEELGRRFGLLEDQTLSTPTRSTAIMGITPHARLGETDLSSPVIAVDHSACILCDRCIRACDDVQSNEVIGRTGKGHAARIVFDLNTPMGESTCVACGECVSECPTGALTNKPVTTELQPRGALKSVDSVCPYCGVGCAVTFHAQPERIVFAEGRESPVNQARLCVKGRYGWDYSTHPQRLTKPLIRRENHYPKGALSSAVQSEIESKTNPARKPGGIVDYAEVLPAFREATWEEALDLVAHPTFDDSREHSRQRFAGRVWLGQVFQRGSLSISEADAGGFWHQ